MLQLKNGLTIRALHGRHIDIVFHRNRARARAALPQGAARARQCGMTLCAALLSQHAQRECEASLETLTLRRLHLAQQWVRTGNHV